MMQILCLSLITISIKSYTFEGFDKPDGNVIIALRNSIREQEIIADILDIDFITNECEELSETSQWTCPISFEFDRSLSENKIPTQIILEAMEYIEQMTDWAFIERTNAENYLVFTSDTAKITSSGDFLNIRRCVGQQGGPQAVPIPKTPILTTSSEPIYSFGWFVHQIMHAIGTYHEQQRTDRWEFVVVDEDNVVDAQGTDFYAANFEIRESINPGEYDFGSITHYNKWALARDPRQMTLTPRSDDVSARGVCYIGQTFELTDADILHLNQLVNGTACSRLSPPPCVATNIKICGADSMIDGFAHLFQTYRLDGTLRGRDRYRSKRDFEGRYFIVFWYNGWRVRWEGDNKDYLVTLDQNLLTATWSQYDWITDQYKSDPYVSVSTIECKTLIQTEQHESNQGYRRQTYNGYNEDRNQNNQRNTYDKNYAWRGGQYRNEYVNN